MESVRLTQFSPGAGCGCKISPADLEDILNQAPSGFNDPKLLVGRESKDDAAVYDAGGGMAIISTTDFFTPIVDDPYYFGKIAATNAMSDVYAMGGSPLMAISILCWPLDKLPKHLAGLVIEGATDACTDAGISLAGGHSIDIPVPIFGLAVTGAAKIENIRRNNTAIEGCSLFLTKPLGIGIISTAVKKGIVSREHLDLSIQLMTTLNKIGTELGKFNGVKAMTDITGFGFLGHLLEICEGSGLRAEVEFRKVPVINGLETYIREKAIPGGTYRNWKSYGHKITGITDDQRLILCDPQTSGGLLIAVEPREIQAFKEITQGQKTEIHEIGQLLKWTGNDARIRVY